jgi:hypothetical protein
MKSLSVIIVGALLIVSIAPQTASGWAIASSEETGHYWMYDDESDPPFTEPEVPPMPGFQNIHNTGSKVFYPNDEPYQYILPDSFWYYGFWYEPGDYLFIAWDGWISFDNSSDEGWPDPPTTTPPFPVSDDPNAIIAPLWQHHNPARTPEPADSNRVYYQYYPENKILIIEWYKIQHHTTGNAYTFEVILQLGGQGLLHIEHDPDRVVFSEHFIHFLYQTSSAGWDADNLHDPPAVGLENQDGTKGIYYQGELVDGRVIRMGYKLSDESVEEDSEVFSDFELKAVTEGRDCRVEFSVPYSTRVKLNVFDAGGRLVKCLADAAFESGTHCLRWDGHEVSSGAYFIRMQAGERQSVSKVVLIR